MESSGRIPEIVSAANELFAAYSSAGSLQRCWVDLRGLLESFGGNPLSSHASVVQFSSVLVQQLQRFDAAFALQLESVRNASSALRNAVNTRLVLQELDCLARAAHAHRTAVTRVLSDLCLRSFPGVLGLVAQVEAMTFWTASFGAALTNVSHSQFPQDVALVATHVLHRGVEPTVIACGWVRVAFEGAGTCELVQSGTLCLVGEADFFCRRVYFDTAKLKGYKKLVTTQQGRYLKLEWDEPADTDLVAVEMHSAKGGFEEAVLPYARGDYIMAGAKGLDEFRGRAVNKFLSKGPSPILQVTSKRCVFVDKQDPNLVLVWDSCLCFSFWQGASSFRFPYQVIRVLSMQGRRSLTPTIEYFLKHALTARMSDFNEYSAGVSLLDESMRDVHPPWVAKVKAPSFRQMLDSRLPELGQRAFGFLAGETELALGSNNNSSSNNVSGNGPRQLLQSAFAGSSSAIIASLPHRPAHEDSSPKFFPPDEETSSSKPNLLSENVGGGSGSSTPASRRVLGLFSRFKASALGASSNDQGSASFWNFADKDPKSWWANERTFLSWIGVLLLLAMASVNTIAATTRVSQYVALFFTPGTVVLMVYALVRFLLRNDSLKRGTKTKHVGVVDWWGPFVLVGLICIVLLISIVLIFLTQSGAISAGAAGA